MSDVLAPHDTLTMPGHVWSVTGVFLGGERSESVIGLQVNGALHDPGAYNRTLPELFVPEILLRRAIECGVVIRHAAAAGGS